jgi:hypothetical protein
MNIVKKGWEINAGGYRRFQKNFLTDNDKILSNGCYGHIY